MNACEHGSSSEKPSYAELAGANESLRLRLAAAEAALHALRSGKVDPDVVSSLDQNGSPSRFPVASNDSEQVLRESMELYRSLFTQHAQWIRRSARCNMLKAGLQTLPTSK